MGEAPTDEIDHLEVLFSCLSICSGKHLILNTMDFFIKFPNNMGNFVQKRKQLFL